MNYLCGKGRVVIHLPPVPRRPFPKTRRLFLKWYLVRAMTICLVLYMLRVKSIRFIIRMLLLDSNMMQCQRIRDVNLLVLIVTLLSIYTQCQVGHIIPQRSWEYERHFRSAPQFVDENSSYLRSKLYRSSLHNERSCIGICQYKRIVVMRSGQRSPDSPFHHDAFGKLGIWLRDVLVSLHHKRYSKEPQDIAAMRALSMSEISELETQEKYCVSLFIPFRPLI